MTVMKKLTLSFLSVLWLLSATSVQSQTTLDTAVNFHVKTIDGDPIWLFDLLDIDNKIVVIDFFSVSCGPCQDYAPEFQASYEDFGENSSNVYYMGINWGADNDAVRDFDSTYNLTYPTVSGTQGGGNGVFIDYNILSYPTVIVIVPEDHLIKNKEIVPPVRDSINNAVLAAGGIMVGIDENNRNNNLSVYPNPARNSTRVTLNLNKRSEIEISVIDLTGKERIKIKPGTYPKGKVTLPVDLHTLANGLYFLRIKYNNSFLTRQLIITH
jgi:thiol-disulfide isomerase/thioredoxin